jgi:hypothetical protein
MKYSIILVLLFSANITSSQKMKFTKVENAAVRNTFIKLEHYLFSMDKPERGNTDPYKEVFRKFFDTSKMNKRIRQMEKLQRRQQRLRERLLF